MSILGTRVLRTEDPLFLTRGGLYTDDVEDERLTGALHVTFVRSPLAQAAARADEGTSPHFEAKLISGRPKGGRSGRVRRYPAVKRAA